MPKFTPLRERILVARETFDSDELERIKKEILDAHAKSGRVVVRTAARLGVNQMTLRRIAEQLDIEAEMGIDRSRAAPSLFFARAHAAVETGDQATIADLRKQVLSALVRARNSGDAGAARILGVTPWVLKKTIDLLGISGEDREFPGKYSLIGERVLVAQKSGNAEELRKIQCEILDAYQASKNDLRRTAARLEISPLTLRKIVATLGLSKALGLDDTHAEPVLLLSRLRVAVESGDIEAIERVEGQVMRAIKRAKGSVKEAAKRLGIGEAALRHLLEELRMTEDVRRRYPGKGKERMLTVRVNGNDVTLSIAGWARVRKMNRTTIIERLRRGYSPELAVEPKDFREG